MKRIKYLLLIILLTATTVTWAQSVAVSKVTNSVFTLTTFRADGSLLASSHGVFVGKNGEAISDLKPFLGAATAVVIDHEGNKMNVTRMLGVNDIYDAAHFMVDGKTTPAPIATTSAAVGEKISLVGYALKKPEITESTVKGVESFMNKYTYYIIGMNAPDNAVACPFVNAKGEVLGLMQISTTTFDTHATDARFIQELTMNALSFGDATVKQIGIPMAMSSDKSQAQLTLVMASQSGDSIKYEAAINDFLALYPNLIDGYDARARRQMANGQFQDADETMRQALKNVDNKEDVHYQFSKLIFDKEVYSTIPYDNWSLDKAYEEAVAAYQVKPLPLYRHLQAQIMFSQKKYQEADDLFTDLYRNTEIKSPELLFESARCKEMLNAPAKEVIALLDSAINTTDTLRILEAAPYFLERANVYHAADSFRQAVFDYNRYEYLMQGRVNANFYYIREQAEVKGRLYQQALRDIARAILLAPNEPLYYAEMASLQLRVNMADKALQTAERCVAIAPEYSEGYLLLGLAQIHTNDKEKGLANLRKAQEMGNEQAQALIDKYGK